MMPTLQPNSWETARSPGKTFMTTEIRCVPRFTPHRLCPGRSCSTVKVSCRFISLAKTFPNCGQLLPRSGRSTAVSSSSLPHQDRRRRAAVDCAAPCRRGIDFVLVDDTSPSRRQIRLPVGLFSGGSFRLVSHFGKLWLLPYPRPPLFLRVPSHLNLP